MLNVFLPLYSTELPLAAVWLGHESLSALYEASDSVQSFAYCIVSVALVAILRRRRHFVSRSTFLTAALVIVTCGLAHLLAAIAVWYPVLRFEAALKAIAALSSLGTAVLLFRLRSEFAATLEGRESQRTVDLQRANEELHRSQDLFDAVLESLPVSIIIANHDGQLVRMNRASERIWGLAPLSDNVAGYDVWTGFRPHSRERINAEEWPLARAVMKGEIVKDELVEIERFGDRERLVLELTAAPVRNQGGQIVGGVVACMDVTERVRAESAVRQSEATLSAVMDALPVSVAICDLNGRITRCNAAAEEIWGVPPDTPGWEQFGDWVGYWPDTNERIKAEEWAMTRALLHGQVIKGELARYERFDTHERGFLLNNAAPVRDSQGHLIGAVAVQVDVTAQKRLEDELRQANAQLEVMLESTPIPILVADTTGTIVRHNRALTERFEIESKSVAEYIGKRTLSTLDGEAMPRSDWPIYRVLRGEEVRNVDVLLSIAGTVRLMRYFGSPIRDASGAITHSVVALLDITDLKRLDQELRAERNRFRAVFSSAAIGVARVSFDKGQWLEVNDAFCRILGYPRHQLIGRPWPEFTHPEDIDLDLVPFRRMAAGEIETYNVEKRFVHKDGHHVWARLTLSLVRDERGNPDFEVCLVEDIGERKLAEEALRSSELRFRTLVEQASDAFFLHDADGRFVDVNRQACLSLGYSREELLQKTVLDVEQDFTSGSFRTVLETVKVGEPATVYGHQRRKDGTCFPVEARLNAYVFGGQRLYLGLVRDISERVAMEQALRESELKFRTLADAVPNLLWIADERGSRIYVNNHYEEFAGTSDWTGMHWLNTVHPDDRSRVMAAWDVAGLQKGLQIEYRKRRFDGSYHWFVSRAIAMQSADGKLMWVGSSTNINDLKATAEALRRSEARFRTLAEAVPNLLWACDADGRGTYLSPRYMEYTGLPEGAMLPDGWYATLHPDDADRTAQAWKRAVQTVEPYEVEYRIRRRDGVYRWFVSRAVPMRNADGRILEWIGSSTDVDSIKRVESALRNSNEDLRQFAYAAAHDLQEPLRNVSNALQLMSRLYGAKIPPQAMPLMTAAIEGSQRGSQMVKDLLRYCRIVDETDSLTELTSANDALTAAIQMLRDKINTAGAVIQSAELPTVPIRHAHLTQIFQNLISNSIKYAKDDTPPLIKISATSNHEQWRFTVSDNGIGFDPEYSTRIFGLFKRLHGREKYEGSGIGLALCSRIVACYGGRIWAESALGEGASFHFTLARTADNV